VQSGPEILSHPFLLHFSHPTIGSVFFKYRRITIKNKKNIPITQLSVIMLSMATLVPIKIKKTAHTYLEVYFLSRSVTQVWQSSPLAERAFDSNSIQLSQCSPYIVRNGAEYFIRYSIMCN